jgi:hypothetical protein
MPIRAVFAVKSVRQRPAATDSHVIGAIDLYNARPTAQPDKDADVP